MDIGTEKEKIISEPIKDPVPQKQPSPPVREPAQPKEPVKV